MKKILQTIALILLSFFSIGGVAQESYTVFGIRGGFGLSNLRGMDKFKKEQRLPSTVFTLRKPYDSQAYFAWDLGFSVQHVHNRFMLQADVSLVSYANTKLKEAYANNKMIDRVELYYNMVDVIMGTKVPVNDNFRIVLGMGPYVGFDVSSWFSPRNARYGKNGDNSDYIYGGVLKDKEADFKETDLGGVILAGIEVNNIQLGLNYYHGLLNVTKNDYSLKNRIYKLSMVYFF